MFKISPVQDENEARMHIESLGGKYFDGAFTYLMKDLECGKIMGASHFEIGEKGLIYSILEPQDSDDFEAMFILARQTMNFIDACGAHYCEADPSYTDARLLRAIGFREILGKWSCSLEGMFDGSHCDGKAKEL